MGIDKTLLIERTTTEDQQEKKTEQEIDDGDGSANGGGRMKRDGEMKLAGRDEAAEVDGDDSIDSNDIMIRAGRLLSARLYNGLATTDSTMDKITSSDAIHNAKLTGNTAPRSGVDLNRS